MNDSLKEFQRKVNIRKFSIDNSWRADDYKKCTAASGGNAGNDTGNAGHELLSLLNDNLSEADGCKYIDGYFPLSSQRRYFGGFVVFCKRAIRKLLKIFLGWYIFPILHQSSHFRGKILNAVSLERDMILQLEDTCSAYQQQVSGALSELREKTNAEMHHGLESVRDEIHDEIKEREAANKNTTDQLRCVLEGLCQRMEEKERADKEKERADREKRQADKERVECLQNEISLLKSENARLSEELAETKSKELHMSDDFYHDFEEAFRGSQEEIKSRLQVYVPIIKSHLADWSKGMFIDIGSGRGEWLDILKDNGAVSRIGVDLNERQNDICREKGHKTVCEDCILYLKRQPDCSIDLITGFQIIEHLPLSVFVQLLEQCKRVLKPGGMILFETQNPNNLIVGADTFYIDPSHIRPLEPRLIEFLVQWAGFTDVQIIPANASPDWVGIDEQTISPNMQDAAKRFNDVYYRLYGPQDYSVFALRGNIT